jgi:phosphate butyryltransferase
VQPVLHNFEDILTRAKQYRKMTISVAVAQDKAVLQAIKAAQEIGLAEAILVGDQDLIKALASEVGLSSDTAIVHEPDSQQAALTAVSLVKQGQAQVLLKGLINSGNFLKAVLNSEVGLRAGNLLSHLFCYEVPGEQKLLFQTDGGINIAPNLAEKKGILLNALQALVKLGIKQPKVAILTANEVVNPKMQSTVDAQGLVAMYQRGELAPAIIEGPIAMDVALSLEAAKHKGIDSKVAGQVDLFLVSSIEVGNILSKGVIHYTHFRNAGVILGAANPIVMVSRSDSAEVKLHSIALACLLAGEK